MTEGLQDSVILIYTSFLAIFPPSASGPVDKLYITHGEWASGEYGGGKAARTLREGEVERPLPLDCCALTFTPVQSPMASSTGYIYERVAVEEYVKKYARDPVTYKPLSLKDLFLLHLERDPSGELICPVTGKPLSSHQLVLAVRPTGRVYSGEGLKRLMASGDRDAEGRQIYHDYYGEASFHEGDLVILNDPSKLEGRLPRNFGHVRDVGEGGASSKGKGIGGQGTLQRSGSEMATHVKDRAVEAVMTEKRLKVDNPPMEASYSRPTGTSTLSMVPVASPKGTDSSQLTMEQRLFREVRDQGKATVRTNYGDMHFILHCREAPRTCYNFLTLARRGYYAGVPFHRLLRGFVLQGGDPTGTGMGGDSCWGRPFPSEPGGLATHHRKRGLLSMANRGDACSNTSQFFVTLAPAAHLDGIHPVFGEMIGGEETLASIERVPVDERGKPLRPVIMEDVIIVEDPYVELRKRIEEEGKRANEGGHPRDTLRRPTSLTPATKHTTSTIGKYIKRPK